jgi:Na+/proline symporter
MFLAVGTMGFEAGILGYIVGLVYFLGMLIMGAYTTRIRYLTRQSNVSNLLDLVAVRISNRAVGIFAFVSFVLYLFLLSGQFVAINIVASYLSTQFGDSAMPYWLATLAVVMLFLYPVVGGLRKDIQTDLFQVLLISVASLIIATSFFSHPVQQLHWNLVPAKLLTGTAYGTIFLIGLVLFYTPSFLVRMDFWQRVIAAKTDAAARSSFFVAGLLAFLFFVFFSTIGIWGNVTGITDAKFATMKILEREIAGQIAYGIVIAAFFAAVLSSADTFINNISLFMARIFHPQMWQSAMTNPNSSDETRILWRSRGYAIVAMLLSLLLAFLVPDLVDLLVAAFSLLLIFLPLIIAVLFERWRSEVASCQDP